MDSIENDTYKREKRNEQRDKFLSMFEDEIQSDLETIRATIKRLRNKSKDWYGYDFRNEAEDFIQDLI